MEQKPHYISICSQKGGVGKSTLTTLVASLLHYRLGKRVMVADCDYPQWSIFEQRRRELELLDSSDYYKLMMIRQYNRTGCKIWPVVECEASSAIERVEHLLSLSQEQYDYVLFDLPGTTATKGILSLIVELERVFIPLKADKMVMESSIVFARMLSESFIPNERSSVQGVHLFWSMIDRRERTPLYEQYEQVLSHFGLRVMQSRIPLRTRFNRELQLPSGSVFRSTLFPADHAFVAETMLADLVQEICLLTENTVSDGREE